MLIPISFGSRQIKPSYKPRSFLQLINELTEPCHVLYVVSPPYLFEVNDDGEVVYDDSVALDEDWETLAHLEWRPAKLMNPSVNLEARKRAEERVVARLQKGITVSEEQP